MNQSSYKVAHFFLIVALLAFAYGAGYLLRPLRTVTLIEEHDVFVYSDIVATCEAKGGTYSNYTIEQWHGTRYARDDDQETSDDLRYCTKNGIEYAFRADVGQFITNVKQVLK